jgi:hypothetical protein
MTPKQNTDAGRFASIPQWLATFNVPVFLQDHVAASIRRQAHFANMIGKIEVGMLETESADGTQLFSQFIAGFGLVKWRDLWWKQERKRYGNGRERALGDRLANAIDENRDLDWVRSAQEKTT